MLDCRWVDEVTYVEIRGLLVERKEELVNFWVHGG